MNIARKTLIGAALSLSMTLGVVGSIGASDPDMDHAATVSFDECVSTMTQHHGGIGRHHHTMNHEGSLGSHLQMMRSDGCEMDMP